VESVYRGAAAIIGESSPMMELIVENW